MSGEHETTSEESPPMAFASNFSTEDSETYTETPSITRTGPSAPVTPSRDIEEVTETSISRMAPESKETEYDEEEDGDKTGNVDEEDDDDEPMNTTEEPSVPEFPESITHGQIISYEEMEKLMDILKEGYEAQDTKKFTQIFTKNGVWKTHNNDPLYFHRGHEEIRKMMTKFFNQFSQALMQWDDMDIIVDESKNCAHAEWLLLLTPSESPATLQISMSAVFNFNENLKVFELKYHPLVENPQDAQFRMFPSESAQARAEQRQRKENAKKKKRTPTPSITATPTKSTTTSSARSSSNGKGGKKKKKTRPRHKRKYTSRGRGSKNWVPWTCSQCEHYNPKTVSKCQNCEKPFKFSEDAGQKQDVDGENFNGNVTSHSHDFSMDAAYNASYNSGYNGGVSFTDLHTPPDENSKSRSRNGMLNGSLNGTNSNSRSQNGQNNSKSSSGNKSYSKSTSENGGNNGKGKRRSKKRQGRFRHHQYRSEQHNGNGGRGTNGRNGRHVFVETNETASTKRYNGAGANKFSRSNKRRTARSRNSRGRRQRFNGQGGYKNVSSSKNRKTSSSVSKNKNDHKSNGSKNGNKSGKRVKFDEQLWQCSVCGLRNASDAIKCTNCNKTYQPSKDVKPAAPINYEDIPMETNISTQATTEELAQVENVTSRTEDVEQDAQMDQNETQNEEPEDDHDKETAI